MGASFTCFVVLNVPQTGDMTSTLRLLCVRWVSTLPLEAPSKRAPSLIPHPSPRVKIEGALTFSVMQLLQLKRDHGEAEQGNPQHQG